MTEFIDDPMECEMCGLDTYWEGEELVCDGCDLLELECTCREEDAGK